jgi:hypothetical protein
MRIKMNGILIEDTAVQPFAVMSEKSMLENARQKMKELFPKAVTASAFLGALNMAGQALASTGGFADRLLPLIHMVQDLALPAAIVVSSWGLIEVIIGNIASGKEKLKYSIIGFLGMFLIPEVFYAIKEAFQRGAGQ